MRHSIKEQSQDLFDDLFRREGSSQSRLQKQDTEIQRELDYKDSLRDIRNYVNQYNNKGFCLG